MSATSGVVRFSPDGLSRADVEALVSEAEAAWLVSPRATSGLLDGSAALRAQRRRERRAVAAVVRALPVRSGVAA